MLMRRHLNREVAAELYKTYDAVIGKFVGMINQSDKWVINKQ